MKIGDSTIETFQIDKSKTIGEQPLPKSLVDEGGSPNGCGIITIFITENDNKSYLLASSRINSESQKREYQISIGGGIKEKNISIFRALNSFIQFKTSDKHPLVNNIGEQAAVLCNTKWEMQYVTFYQKIKVSSLQELKNLTNEINLGNKASLEASFIKDIQYQIFDFETVIASTCLTYRLSEGENKHNAAKEVHVIDFLSGESIPTFVAFDDIATATLANNVKDFTKEYKLVKDLPVDSKRKLLNAGFSEKDSIDENIEGIGGSSALTGHFILTPLAYAARQGDLNLVRDLVRNGADVNLKDDTYEHTPLMWASSYGRHNVVNYLLQSGADATLTSSRLYAGSTAYDLTKCFVLSPTNFWYASQKCLGTGNINKTRALLEAHQSDFTSEASGKKFQ